MRNQRDGMPLPFRWGRVIQVSGSTRDARPSSRLIRGDDFDGSCQRTFPDVAADSGGIGNDHRPPVRRSFLHVTVGLHCLVKAKCRDLWSEKSSGVEVEHFDKLRTTPPVGRLDGQFVRDGEEGHRQATASDANKCQITKHSSGGSAQGKRSIGADEVEHRRRLLVLPLLRGPAPRRHRPTESRDQLPIREQA